MKKTNLIALDAASSGAGVVVKALEQLKGMIGNAEVVVSEVHFDRACKTFIFSGREIVKEELDEDTWYNLGAEHNHVDSDGHLWHKWDAIENLKYKMPASPWLNKKDSTIWHEGIQAAGCLEDATIEDDEMHVEDVKEFKEAIKKALALII